MALGDALRDIADAIGGAIGSIGSAFSGGGDGGGGAQNAPRPRARPSIVQRGSELYATRDVPGTSISEGQTAPIPEYGSLSFRGLTSSDPGNVMRNVMGTERLAATAPADGGDGDAGAPKGARPAPEAPAAAAAMAGEAKGARPAAEGTGESAAARARRLGLAATIATSPGGLLSDTGSTRQRRSLIGGGLIR